MGEDAPQSDPRVHPCPELHLSVPITRCSPPQPMLLRANEVIE